MLPFFIDFTSDVFSFPSKGGLPKTKRKRRTPTDQTSLLAATKSFSQSISPQTRSGDIKYSEEMLLEENFLRRKPDEMQKFVTWMNRWYAMLSDCLESLFLLA